MSQKVRGGGLTPLLLEPRLQKHYQKLVQKQLKTSQSLAAGLHALPGMGSRLASTQAAWRFYRNERVSLPALAQPLIEEGRHALQAGAGEYGLVIHDWSHLNFDRLPAKLTELIRPKTAARDMNCKALYY